MTVPLNLEYLDISNNNFTKVPEIINNMSDLISLLLCNNELMEISSAIENLVHLENLELSGNQIEKGTNDMS